MMLTIRQLAHARALALHRNFREAAAAVHLTQSALSRSIQALERSVGEPLFDRLAGAVEPTRFGELLLERSLGILRDTAELEREMTLLRGLQAGSLVIASGPYPSADLVPRAIAACLERMPGLQCRVQTAPWRDATRLLLDRECELAVAEASLAAGDARFTLDPLGREPLQWVCRRSHPLAALRRPTLADVLRFPVAACRVPARLAGAFAGAPRAGTLDAASGDFLPAILVESVDAALRVVCSSDAVTAVPAAYPGGPPGSVDLVALAIAGNPVRLDNAVIRLRGRTQSPAARLFVEQLRALRSGHTTEPAQRAPRGRRARA